MNKNCRLLERILRFWIGAFLLAWAFAGGPFWGYIGIFFLATGAWGLCPIYWALQIRE